MKRRTAWQLAVVGVVLSTGLFFAGKGLAAEPSQTPTRSGEPDTLPDLLRPDAYGQRPGDIELGRDTTLKEAMDEVFKVLTTLLEDAGLDTPARQRRFLEYIEKVRYGKNNTHYFWVNDLQGKVLMEPFLPELVGKDLSDLTDPNGIEVFYRFNRIALEKGQGFVPHLWPKNEVKNWSLPKVSLVRLFKPWNWVVGTGTYLKTIEDFEIYGPAIEDRLPASPI